MCARCPTARSAISIAASIGLPLLLTMIFGGLFVLRSMMPRGMMKVCVCEIVQCGGDGGFVSAAHGSGAVSTPWPMSRVFLPTPRSTPPPFTPCLLS